MGLEPVKAAGGVPVMGLDDWAGAPPLLSEQPTLEPLGIDHADEMVPLLEDPALHTFIGGKRATLQELRSRYTEQTEGQPPEGRKTGSTGSCVVARTAGGRLRAGHHREQNGELTADGAWVVAVAQHRAGYVREVAQLLADWLRQQHIQLVGASCPPATSRLESRRPLDWSRANRFAVRRRSALARIGISLRWRQGCRGCRGCGGGGKGAQPRQVRIRHGDAVTVEERPGLLSWTDKDSNGCSGADAGSTRLAHERERVYATFVVLPAMDRWPSVAPPRRHRR